MSAWSSKPSTSANCGYCFTWQAPELAPRRGRTGGAMVTAAYGTKPLGSGTALPFGLNLRVKDSVLLQAAA